MKCTLYILCIILLITIVNAHGHHDGGKPVPHYGGLRPANNMAKDACSYTTDKHEHYDLHLFNTYYPGDLHVYDVKSGYTLYFNPCGGVHSYSSACGANSSICLVSPAGKAVSYASSHSFISTLLPATTSNSRPSLEVMYGQGELCSTGVARKAVVTYTCSHLDTVSKSFNDYKVNYPIQKAEVGDCFVSINIESPFACPVDDFCASIHSIKDCDQQPPCGWMFGKCQKVSVLFGVEIGLTIFLAMVSLGCLFLCCCCFCMVYFVKKSTKSNKKNLIVKKEKKTRRVSQKKSNSEAIEMESFESPYQLVPGGFVAVEEYSHIQGFPNV